MDINLKTLIGKLNDTTRAAATRAAGICVGLGQYEVDIEHVFLALLEQPGSDVVAAARQAGISLTGLETELRREVERFPSGSTRTPVFSRHLPLLFEHAWSPRPSSNSCAPTARANASSISRSNSRTC